MKHVGLVICICTLMVLVAGCTTTCIPVKPTGVIYDSEGLCSVIMDGKAYGTLRSFDCDELVINETNNIRFSTIYTGSPLTEICSVSTTKK